MTIYRLSDELIFPDPALAEPSGLLAVGGDLSPERLLLAYSQGIFPWYEEGLPILWHSPDPRMVLRPDEIRISRSLRRSLRRAPFEIRLDSDFPAVIQACSDPRPGQAGTWITQEMIRAYCELFDRGFAHSAEAWAGDELVGGLYGISLGASFFGESMFARRSDASKLAFALLVGQLQRWEFDLIDCQIYTEHLSGLGATSWPRERFLTALRVSLARPTRRGQWHLDDDLADTAGATHDRRKGVPADDPASQRTQRSADRVLE